MSFLKSGMDCYFCFIWKSRADGVFNKNEELSREKAMKSTGMNVNSVNSVPGSESSVLNFVGYDVNSVNADRKSMGSGLNIIS